MRRRLGSLFVVALAGLCLAPAPPPAARIVPGRGACPEDMRLVEGKHFQKVEHTCTDLRDKHCYAFTPGARKTEEPVTRVRVCMDAFEAPNVRGQRPIVMKTSVEAEAWCGERGKRLCTEAEWESACEGPDMRPWVYGWSADPKTCNSGKAWRPFRLSALRAGGEVADAEVARLWQGEPSGARPGCVSKDGVFDLMGNVEEWVRSRPNRRFPAALKGGFWAKPWSSCRGTNDAHEPKFRFYEVGFRCCKDPL